MKKSVQLPIWLNKTDAVHRTQLNRLLSEILDDIDISSNIYFKGGSCATMLGWLDRFSVDLDFDIKVEVDKTIINNKLKNIFTSLDLLIKQKSRQSLFYVLKYQSNNQSRNTIKVSFIDKVLKSNIYKSYYLPDIDRYANCQTIETMFANKLVALTDRYQKNKTIAGRDLYDIHYFFSQGYHYREEIIKERTNKNSTQYFQNLLIFIKDKINSRIIDEDLNFLLPMNQKATWRKPVDEWLSVQGSALSNSVWTDAPA